MRLIDAKKLCLYLADIQLANRGWKDDYCDVLDDIISIIDEQTTIEAEPVRHGRWNIRTFDLPREGYYCSECGTVEWRTSRFCPNCGAKMEGKNEDGID